MKLVKANAFVGIVKSGGSTKPWIVQVNDGNALVPYIVKLFTETQTQQFQPIAKEVFGNVLAQEFDLHVPSYALIEFSDTFSNSLPERESLRLREVPKGPKFGSVEIVNASIVDIRQQQARLKTYDLGTIFAFDNLIRNIDRGGFRNKPNLLLDDDTLILIDHEQIFPFANDAHGFNDYVMPSFDQNEWPYPFGKHLFYPLLKRLPPSEKTSVFDTFEYFLRNLSFETLDSAAQSLTNMGIEIGNYTVIRKHLIETKVRAGEFCQFLRSLIA